MVARDLAEKINGTLIPVTAVIDQDRIQTDAAVIGMVFPIYDFKPPRIIGRFITKLDNPKTKYIFAVCTYGITPGKAMQHVKRELSACGGTLAGGFVVRMPHNGFGSAAISSTEHAQMFASWKQQQVIISDYVLARKQGTLETSNEVVSFIFSGFFLKAIPILLPLFTQVLLKGWNSLTLVADEKCNGCGVCQRICPVGNIAMIDNKPVWSNHCEKCFACLHWCPREAIQAGRITINMKRYHHPEVKLADMIQGGKRKSA
ncbi:MAG: EFR1 family ferrodoxin [Methanolinea sp.]|nr:MAG: EFR1 family ferrodoxin [Methanolinea sp.]